MRPDLFIICNGEIIVIPYGDLHKNDYVQGENK